MVSRLARDRDRRSASGDDYAVCRERQARLDRDLPIPVVADLETDDLAGHNLGFAAPGDVAVGGAPQEMHSAEPSAARTPTGSVAVACDLRIASGAPTSATSPGAAKPTSFSGGVPSGRRPL